ncbi:MAG: transposase [Paludibacteraceae bacterium]
MAEYSLDKDLIARLIFALLPHEPPYSIAIDKTNWKFGQTNINILVLAIVYKGKSEFQIIISLCKPEIAQKIYKERWQIETAFRAMKTSGFNVEDTHLTDIERIKKLVAFVLIAFT